MPERKETAADENRHVVKENEIAWQGVEENGPRMIRTVSEVESIFNWQQ
jgi:hypothetical protein